MRKKYEMKTTEINIGSNIGNWRKFRGLKQEALAKKMDISPTALSKIENGESEVSFSRLESFAKALDIEVSQLLSSPQQIFNLENSHQSNAIVYGNNTQTNIDKLFLEKLLHMMENITTYFMTKNKSA
jgi:transcriptional regulator with XRE-family HTH domain